nr:hypothetical protein [Crenothrix polyspora]
MPLIWGRREGGVMFTEKFVGDNDTVDRLFMASKKQPPQSPQQKKFHQHRDENFQSKRRFALDGFFKKRQ